MYPKYLNHLPVLGIVLTMNLAKAAPATVKVDGSSTVFPVTEAVAEEFQSQSKDRTRVTVGISGTGGGFKKFCRGETDVQNASRPISIEEMQACKAKNVQYIELPVAFDAITVVVSPKNQWLSSIKVEDLKKLWEPSAQGKVKTWKQIRAEWPDEEIKLFGAGSDSGTFDYFTEAVVGKAKSSRGDYTGSEDDNTLVQGISGDKNALGYLPYSYYEANQKRLKVLAIDGGAKAPKKGPIAPTAESVENGSYFPLSRPIFIYVSVASLNKPEVRSFTEFYIKNSASISRQVKYIPLPAKAYELSLKHLAQGRKGTVFKGKTEVGLSIEELLRREASL